MQHLDIPNLRGRNIERSNGRDEEIRSKSDKASDFRTTEEAKDGYGGSNQRNEPKPETTERGEGRAKNGREARTKTWSDVVKDPEEDKSETTDSIAKSDPDKTDPMKGKRTRRPLKPTPI